MPSLLPVPTCSYTSDVHFYIIRSRISICFFCKFMFYLYVHAYIFATKIICGQLLKFQNVSHTKFNASNTFGIYLSKICTHQYLQGDYVTRVNTSTGNSLIHTNPGNRAFTIVLMYNVVAVNR